MNPNQVVQMPDFAKRRERVNGWLDECIATTLKRGKPNKVGPKEPRYRVWSDGTVSADQDLEAFGPLPPQLRRIDIFGEASGHDEISVDAWQRVQQVTDTSRPGLLPLREPEVEGRRRLAMYTYWEGDYETCLTVRCLICEWLASVHAIERDEAMTWAADLKKGLRALMTAKTRDEKNVAIARAEGLLR